MPSRAKVKQQIPGGQLKQAGDEAEQGMGCSRQVGTGHNRGEFSLGWNFGEGALASANDARARLPAAINGIKRPEVSLETL